MTANRKKFKDFFSINKINVNLIPLLILLGIVINLIIGCFLDILAQIPNLSSEMQNYSESANRLIESNVIFNAIVIAIIVPIFEEIIFRVLPLNKMIPRIPPALAIILTSIVFGASHGQIIWVIYTSLFGVLLGNVIFKI